MLFIESTTRVAEDREGEVVNDTMKSFAGNW